MKPFSFYLARQDVRRIEADPQLAKSLRRRAEERRRFVLEGKNIPADILLEQLYESLRIEVEAFLAEAGYKSFSHVATIAFARECLLGEAECVFFNNLRELRNAARYEGREISAHESENAAKKVPELIKKLRKKNPKE